MARRTPAMAEGDIVTTELCFLGNYQFDAVGKALYVVQIQEASWIPRIIGLESIARNMTRNTCFDPSSDSFPCLFRSCAVIMRRWV